MQQVSQDKKSSLADHKNSTPESKLVQIEHQYPVPVHQLFAAFTNAEAIKAWWWPNELYTDRVDLDFRVGGKFFINMKGFAQGGNGMTGQFLEIVENERILMSDQFADENGKAISAKEAKMPGAWPEQDYITFEFKSLGNEASRLTLFQEGVPNVAQADCKEGWASMLDKLEKYLNAQKH